MAMVKSFDISLLVAVVLINCLCSTLANSVHSNKSDDCYSKSAEKFFLCRGSRAIRNMIVNLSKTNKPIVIFPGLEIVATNDTLKDYHEITESHPGSSTSTNHVKDTTLISQLTDYLKHHVIKIKFADLLRNQGDSFRSIEGQLELVQRELWGVKTDGAANVEEARKKDKGQSGYLLMMALTIGKFLTVLGIGSIAALAMKALGVSMMALMMSGMMGVKSMSQDHETKHSVQYVSADTHRKRRNIFPTSLSLPIAYQGWKNRVATSGIKSP